MKIQNMEDEIPWAQCVDKPLFKHKKIYNQVHIAHGSNHHTWQTT
jgi:hypothetical protein